MQLSLVGRYSNDPTRSVLPTAQPISFYVGDTVRVDIALKNEDDTVKALAGGTLFLQARRADGTLVLSKEFTPDSDAGGTAHLVFDYNDAITAGASEYDVVYVLAGVVDHVTAPSPFVALRSNYVAGTPVTQPVSAPPATTRFAMFEEGALPDPALYAENSVIVVHDVNAVSNDGTPGANRWAIRQTVDDKVSGINGPVWMPFGADLPNYPSLSALPDPVRDGMMALCDGIDVSQAGIWYRKTSSSTPIAPRPVITSFSPASGTPGTVVHVVGKNFTGVNFAMVGGVQANFVIIDATHMDITVPDAASSGPIFVSSSVASDTTGTNFLVTPGDAYGQVVFADSPLLWWRMNAGPYHDGSVLSDASGHSQQGNMHGEPTHVTPGIVGTDASVPMGSGPSTWITSQMTFRTQFATPAPGATIEFYLKLFDSGSPGDLDIGSGGTVEPGINAHIALVPGVPQPFTVKLAGSVANGPTLSTVALAFGQRYHIAFSYDRATDTGRLYLNGAEVASAGSFAPHNGSGQNDWMDATQQFGFGRIQAWVGSLQEVAAYGSALSAAQILAHYNASL